MRGDSKDIFYKTLNLDTEEIMALKHFKKIKALIEKDEEKTL